MTVASLGKRYGSVTTILMNELKRDTTMKKSIFDKKMESPKFKAVYDEVSAKMSIGEQIAELRHKAKMSQLELA